MIFSLILWVLIGVATGYAAAQRGRDPYIWFALGIFLGLLGLLLLIVLPNLAEKPEGDSTDNNSLTSKEASETKIELVMTPQDYLNKQWFCIDKERVQQGPLSFEILKGLFSAGKIDAASFVWGEGMNEWKKIENLPEFVDTLNKTITTKDLNDKKN